MNPLRKVHAPVKFTDKFKCSMQYSRTYMLHVPVIETPDASVFESNAIECYGNIFCYTLDFNLPALHLLN
jgi:hypothetical protein